MADEEERCPECGGRRGEGYSVHTSDCQECRLSIDDLAPAVDEDTARRLRESLWPGDRVVNAAGLKIEP